MKRLLIALQDLSNYLFIGRVIRKNRHTDEWKKLNLRVGWFNTVYAVINLPGEVYEAEPDLHRLYVVGEVSAISDYFGALNIVEIVEASIEKIERVDGQKDSEEVHAYLVTFPPLLRELTLWLILKWVGLISLVIWLQLRFQLVQTFVGLVEHGFNFLKSHI